MAKPAFIKESMITTTDLDYENIHCPNCSSNERFSLFGYTMNSREELYEEGELVDVKSFNERPSFDLQAMFCYICHTKFTITNPTQHALQKANLELNAEVQKLTNNKRDPLGTGLLN